jgi:hypothetical protein
LPRHRHNRGPGSAVHRHSASKTRVNALVALHVKRGHIITPPPCDTISLSLGKSLNTSERMSCTTA